MYKTFLIFFLFMIASLPVFADSSIQHNVGKVMIDVSDWGALCKITETEEGISIFSNFIYGNKSYLDPFSDIWVGDSLGNVASAFDYVGGDTPVMGEWIANAPSGIITNVSDSPNATQTIHAQYTPIRHGGFPYDIAIDQYTYAWDSSNYPSDDDYVIMKLVLTNNGNTELKDIFIAIQTNLDVDYDDWEDDLMDWDSDRRAGFAYDSNGSDETVVGLVLLNGKLASHNIIDATDWTFLDADRSKLMSNGEIDNLAKINSKPANYLNVISSGAYNIPANGSVTVIYAFVAGQSVDEFRINVNSAIERILTPAKLTADPDNTSVTLSWAKSISSDIVSYKIYRSKTSGSRYSLIGQAETNTFVDKGVEKGSLSYYVVSAITADGKESKYSNEIASAPGVPPKAPSNLTAKSDSSGKPLLQWEKPDDAEVTGYRIYRNSTGDAPWTAIATVDRNAQSFIDFNTYNGNTYYYAIASINVYNWISELSNVVSLNLQPFALPSSIDLRDVKAIPQPCSTKVRFINLTPVSDIRIYTIDGRLVKTIYHISGSGEEEWDLLNENGVPLANGIYVYYIESFKDVIKGKEANKYVIKGKMAVVR